MDDEKAKEFVTDDNDFSSVGLRSLVDIQINFRAITNKVLFHKALEILKNYCFLVEKLKF